MKLNKLNLLIAATLIVFSTTLKAQDFIAGFGGGGATFGMNSTKNFNQTIIKSLPFQPVIKDNFPPWVFSRIDLLFFFPKNMAFGYTVSSTSTGSRMTLSDYSGKYTFDNVQQGIFPGIKLLFGKNPMQTNGMNVSFEAGVSLSSMKIKEDLTLSGESTKDESNLKAMGIFLQPGVNYIRVLNAKIRLSADLSYYFGIEKGYHSPGNKDARLINPDSHEPVKPQWDGIRIGVTLYYSFKKTIK